MHIKSLDLSKYTLYAKLILAGQIALIISALSSSLVLIVISLPLQPRSWSIGLAATSVTVLSVFFAMILFFIAAKLGFKKRTGHSFQKVKS